MTNDKNWCFADDQETRTRSVKTRYKRKKIAVSKIIITFIIFFFSILKRLRTNNQCSRKVLLMPGFIETLWIAYIKRLYALGRL